MAIYYDSAKNPQTNVVDRPYTIRSAGKGGSTTNTIGTTDVTIPSAPNFPSTDSGATSTSYHIFLPFTIYKTSTNTTSFSVYNETQGRALTIVDQDASLTDYTCKFFSQDSERRNMLEVHVGSTSNEASDSLSWEGKADGSLIYAERLNNLEVETLNINSSAVIFSGDVTYSTNVDFSGAVTFSSNVVINGAINSSLSVVGNISCDSDFYNSTISKIITGGSTNNDCCPGGMTLRMSSASTETFGDVYFSLKSNSVSHGVTGYAGRTIETDTIRHTYFNDPLNQGLHDIIITQGAAETAYQMITIASSWQTGYELPGTVDFSIYRTNGSTVIRFTNLSKNINIFTVLGSSNLTDNFCIKSDGRYGFGNSPVLKAISTTITATPTNAEITTALGQSTDASAGFLGVIYSVSSTRVYLCASNGSTNWYHVSMTKAV